jgi:hypothetical protein
LTCTSWLYRRYNTNIKRRSQDKLTALATLTMEMKDAEEEEPTLFDSVD